MTKYVCYFSIHGKAKSVILPRTISDIRSSAGGFWVDSNYKWCVAESKVKYWIPAHRVDYVEKLHGSECDE